MIPTHANDIQRMIATSLAAGLVPMVWGSPAIGKSDHGYQTAEKMNLYYIDIRLTQYDPTDMVGLPFMQDGRSMFAPPFDIPLTQDEIPAGYDGWLINFDELPQAQQDVQKAMFKVALDRKVGQHNVHPKCYMMAAGNLETDRAGTNKMLTPLNSRLVHFLLEPDFDQWMSAFATQTFRDPQGELPNIDERIQAFLEWKQDLFYKFDPNSDERTFPAPRTWEFVSKLLRVGEPELELVAGAVGVGPAQEFITYINNRKELPTLAQIVADPKGTPVPTRGDLVYTLFSAMIRELTSATLDKVVTYIEKSDMEYQHFLFHSLSKRNPSALQCPAGIQWMAKFAREVA